MSNLISIEQISTNALEVFTGESDALELIINQIEHDARSIVADVNTAKGRDAIRSNAANVAKAKARIDDAGKTLVSELKELPKKIDASRKSVRDRLDSLRDEVRRPLTDWETEQERIRTEAEAKAKAEAEAAEAERIYLLNWDEALVMNDRFDIDIVKAAIEAEKQRVIAEQQAKERAEREEKERAEREERIKQQAIEAEQAKQKAAIEKAEAEKKAAEQAAAAAIEKARIEKELAEENAKKQAEQAEARRLQAVEDERKRVAEEHAKQKAIDDAKAADLEHRKAVNNDIKTCLVDNGFSDYDAIKIINLAAKGQLGFLYINY